MRAYVLTRGLTVAILRSRGRASGQARSLADPMSLLVEQIHRIIEEHYADPLTAESIAGRVRRRAEHVAARFHEETGATIHERLTQARMRAAARLLADGHKVYSVAALVGYKSRKSFYLQFERAYGTTPGAYAASAPSGDAAPPSVRPAANP